MNDDSVARRGRGTEDGFRISDHRPILARTARRSATFVRDDGGETPVRLRGSPSPPKISRPSANIEPAIRAVGTRTPARNARRRPISLSPVRCASVIDCLPFPGLNPCLQDIGKGNGQHPKKYPFCARDHSPRWGEALHSIADAGCLGRGWIDPYVDVIRASLPQSRARGAEFDHMRVPVCGGRRFQPGLRCSRETPAEVYAARRTRVDRPHNNLPDLFLQFVRPLVDVGNLFTGEALLAERGDGPWRQRVVEYALHPYICQPHSLVVRRGEYAVKRQCRPGLTSTKRLDERLDRRHWWHRVPPSLNLYNPFGSQVTS